MAIAKAQKDGKLIRGVESNIDIVINGKSLRTRRYDYIEELAGKVTHVECKAWVPGNVKRLLTH